MRRVVFLLNTSLRTIYIPWLGRWNRNFALNETNIKFKEITLSIPPFSITLILKAHSSAFDFGFLQPFVRLRAFMSSCLCFSSFPTGVILSTVHPHVVFNSVVEKWSVWKMPTLVYIDKVIQLHNQKNEISNLKWILTHCTNNNNWYKRWANIVFISLNLKYILLSKTYTS